jgi:hypothetical protein
MGKPLEHRGALTLMALAVVVAIVAAYAAVPSGASQYNVTPGQIAALNAKVNKLQKQVRALNKTVNALGTIVVNCVTYKALGVARNGVPPSEGYVYQNAAGSQFATALDLAPASSAPVFLLTTPPQCASVIGTQTSVNATGARGGRAPFVRGGRSHQMLSGRGLRAAVATIAAR